jgi:uncharacterized lipoprotein YmbA
MTSRLRCLLAGGLFSYLAACASIHPDHFYALQALPSAPTDARDQLPTEVSLGITLPSMVDRSQVVLSEGNGIVLLEHERWASPLSDQLGQVLGQDLEQRRTDVLITSRPLSQADVRRATVHIDVVALTLARGRPVTLEARWRVEVAGTNPSGTGRAVFTATPKSAGAAAMALAISECVASLADRLVPLLGTAAKAQP